METGKSPSLHPECLEHGVPRIGVEAGLELGEQLAGDSGDVGHAGHRQQDAPGAGIESHLERLCQILDGLIWVSPRPALSFLCFTVMTGATTSCSVAPPWTNRAPPEKWNRWVANQFCLAVTVNDHRGYGFLGFRFDLL